MTIQLKPGQAQAIGQAIQAGLITQPDDVVDVGLEAIRQRLKAAQTGAPAAAVAAEAWEGEFDAWIAGFPDMQPLSDEALSRESMYPDRW
jgi:hypothetical protein